MVEYNTIKLYPVLLNEEIQNVDVFRLENINDTRKQRREITEEINDRERFYKKYNKIITTLSVVETMAECGGIASGTVGIVGIASVVASPVGFVLRFWRYGDGDEIREKQAQ